MESANQETKNKQIRFSIGSYCEKDKRVINKITSNGLFSMSNYIPLRKSATATNSFKTILREKSGLFDENEATKYNTLPNPLRVKNSTIQTKKNFTHQNGGTILDKLKDSVQKPTCPPSLKNNCCLLVETNEPQVNKPLHPPKLCNSRSILPEPDLKHQGKVALIVTAYEGEPKTPTRLEFLPQTRLSRSSSKTSSDASNSVDNVELISSRLQDELVATLRKSNLKKKNDVPENGKYDILENYKQISTDDYKQEANFVNGNVKKLTAVLGKTLIRNEQIRDENI